MFQRLKNGAVVEKQNFSQYYLRNVRWRPTTERSSIQKPTNFRGFDRAGVLQNFVYRRF